MNEQPRSFDGARGVLIRLLEEARKRLIETGARNRLIHTPRDRTRTNSITVVGGNADEVFLMLARKRTPLSFVPAADERDTQTGAANLPLLRAAGNGGGQKVQTILPSFDANSGGQRLKTTREAKGSGQKLHTQLTSEVLQKRLLRIYRDARTLEEEQGVNILFLAVGFLRWFEDERSEIAREAPLLLIPVALTRDNARSSFRLVVREDDLAANLPLQERLKDFGIDLPGIPNAEDWVPTSYFAAIRRAIGTQPRWSLDERGMMLGFFSFSKFLMFRDLQHSSWPDDALLNHPIISGLLANGLPSE